MRRAERKRIQPSTSEHVATLLKTESELPKPTSKSPSASFKPVTELLWGAFGGCSLALVEFLDKVLLNHEGVGCEKHYLVLSRLHEKFLELFLEHCRELKLEDSSKQPPQGEPDPDNHLCLPVKEEEKSLPDGAKKVTKKRLSVAVSFYSSHRLRVRYIPNTGPPIDRDYETVRGITLLCHTLVDARLKGRKKLCEIPHLIVRSMLESASVSKPNDDGPRDRREFLEGLLCESARQDPFTTFVFKCPFIFDTMLLETDVRRKEALIESSKRLKTVIEKKEGEPRPEESSALQAPLDTERLTLAIYLTYRLLISNLDVTVGQSETSFCLVMYLFEEAVGKSRNSSGLFLASKSSIDSAKKDISTNPFLFERVLKVADYAIRFVLSKATVATSDPNVIKPPRPPKVLSLIYEATLQLKLSLDRIKRVDGAKEEDISSLRRMFFWQRNLQLTWRIVELEFQRRFSPQRAAQARLFATEFPECCAFMLDPSVTPETFIRSVHHMNKMHPMFRFIEIAYTDEGVRFIKNDGDFPSRGYFTRYVPGKEPEGDDEDAEKMRYRFQAEAEATAKGLRGPSYFSLLTDGTSRAYILFNDPRAHQRFCNFSVMEAITTPRQEKLMLLYPLLLRMYSGVFGCFDWCPTDLSRLASYQSVYRKVLENDFGAKGSQSGSAPSSDPTLDCNMKPNLTPDNIDQVDFSDDHENLALFVNSVFFQLCRYTISEVKKLQDTLHADVLDGKERDFKTYRFFHRICATMDDYMADFPYFVKKEGESERPHTEAKTEDPTPKNSHRTPHVIDDISLMEERMKGLAYTCEVLLCFMCLGSVHTLKGDTLFRLKKYLDDLSGDKAGRHDSLRNYLEVLDSYNANRNKIVEGSQNRITLSFDRDLAYQNNLFIQSPGVFDDLIFPDQFLNEAGTGSARKEHARINTLFYTFISDKHLSIDVRGQVLFDMDHQRQRVSKAAYFRQFRNPKIGSDVRYTDSIKAPTPDRSSAVSYSPLVSPSAPPTPRGTRRQAEHLMSLFKAPDPRRKRSLVDSSGDSELAHTFDDASSDTRAAIHVQQVASSAKRTTGDFSRLAAIRRQQSTEEKGMKYSELPIKAIERDKMTEYDVYRGLSTIRSCGPLKSLCVGYSDAFCYDLEWDLPKSIVSRGLEAAVEAFERKYVEMKNKLKAVDKKLSETHPNKKDISKLISEAPPKDEDEIQAEKNHKRIIAFVSKISPPALVKGMYCGRGNDGYTREMRDVVREVITECGYDPNPEPSQRLRYRKHIQRLPIAYAPGSYHNITEVMGSLTHLGKWRYEACAEFRISAAAALQGVGTSISPEFQACSSEPMSRLLRTLEWMLYHRCKTQEERELSSRKSDDELNSPLFWYIDADRYVWYQLNSRLPVDFTPITNEEIEEAVQEEEESRDEESASSSEGEDSIMDDISLDDSPEVTGPEEKSLQAGELADVADHFWTVKSPLSFLDNSGWTLRISSKEREAEADVERGGPPISDGLSQILGEYSQTISNLIVTAQEFPENPMEGLPTVDFIKSHVEVAKKALEGKRPPPPHDSLFDSDKEEESQHVPVPVDALATAPAPRAPTRRPGDVVVMEDFRIDSYGSNCPSAAVSARPADPMNGAMQWPAALYIGERSAAAAFEIERRKESTPAAVPRAGKRT
jgi:hypothetical protein